MNPWQGINRFLQTIWDAIRAAVRVRTWTPFLLYLLLQLIILVLLYFAVRPPLTDLTRALPEFVIPPGFFSYPLHLLLIPLVLFNRLFVPLGLFAESLLMAAATWIFVRFALRESLPGLRQAIADVRFGYLQFILFWLLTYVLLLGYQYLFDLSLGDLWIGSVRRRMALDLAGLGGAAALNSLLAYSTIVIILERTGFWGTLKGSLKAFGRHWLATLSIVGAGTLMLYPSSYLMQNAPDWIGRFSGMQTTDPLASAWVLDKDGGDFDHITGATVTSHAVVSAVRNAVIYFDAHRDELLGHELPGDELLGDEPPGTELLDIDEDAE